MKILLANPPYKIKLNNRYERYFVRAGSRWPFSIQKKVDEKPIYVPYPFFLGYTSSIIRKKGYKVTALDGVALDLNENEFIEYVLEKSPDIILMETTTPTFQYDVSLSEKIKKRNKNIIIVMTGTHVTVFPDEALNSEYVDYVIAGEYEIAFTELADRLYKNLSVENLKGVSFKKNGKVIFGGYTELIYPLDLLPLPDRKIFPDDEKPDINIYWDGFCQYKPAIQIHASRGCPFRCYFCLWNQVMYKNGKYRIFSLERIIKEIESVIEEFHPKEIYFDDDDFTVRKDYVINICKEIIKRKLKIKWSCMGNIMNLDEEMIYWMSKSGCIGIKFGVESANKDILKSLGKPMDLKKVKYNVYLLNKYRIKTHATFTFGLLGETLQTMKQTIDFSKKLDTDTVQFSITVPYPGTKFFSILRNQNFIDNLDLKEFDGSCKCLFNYPTLNKYEIEKFLSSAYTGWIKSKLLNLKWVLRQIKRVIKILFYGNKESRKYIFKVMKRVITYWVIKK